jgi:hypothetical protein
VGNLVAGGPGQGERGGAGGGLPAREGEATVFGESRRGWGTEKMGD